MRPVPWGEVVALVRRAGEAILPHWRADVAVRSKADESPVTAADLAAHHILEAGLRALAPDIPVLSEEDCEIPLSERGHWRRWWLVDPWTAPRSSSPVARSSPSTWPWSRMAGCCSVWSACR